MSDLLNHSRVLLKLAAGCCSVVLVGCSLFGGVSQDPVNPSNSGSTTPSPVTSDPNSSGEPTNLPSSEPTASPNVAVSPQPSAPASPSLQPATEKPSPLPKKEQQEVSKIIKDTEEKGKVARQDTGKTYLDNILLLQQTERFVGGTFVSDLAQLSDEVPNETAEYEFKILKADTKETVVVAIAKIPGITSYVGAAYSVEGSTPISGVCRSNIPAQQAPGAPKLVAGKTIQCASGSTATE